MQAELGRDEEAAGHLADAEAAAESVDVAEIGLLAAARRAGLPGGEPARVVARLPELDERGSVAEHFELNEALWRATGDPERLAAARDPRPAASGPPRGPAGG